MKKRIFGVLAAVALLSVVTAGIGKANAYFTTYAQARGGHVIELGDETEIEEEFTGKEKKVTITNKADSKQAVWVRAKGIAGSLHQLDPPNNDNWIQDVDGFYRFKTPLLPGESTNPEFIIGVHGEKIEPGKSIDIVVVYESTPAIENDISGTHEYNGHKYEDPDWNAEGWTRRTVDV